MINKQLGDDYDKDKYVLERLESITEKITLIENKLNNYNSDLLKHYSYLSTKTTLNVIISKVLKLGPFKWIKPLQKLFKKSSEKLRGYIERSTNTKIKFSLNKFLNYKTSQKGGGKDKIIYYTDENLTNDVILGSLYLLQLENPELFSNMDISELMFDINSLDIDEIIGRKEVSQENLRSIEEFNNFCTFFKFYLNSENSIKYSITPELYDDLNDDIININSKLEFISMTNYIWNFYSRINNLEEAIVEGTSDTVDQLSLGPDMDEEALENYNLINMIKLLEGIGNELKDSVIETETEKEAAHSMILLKGELIGGNRKNKKNKHKKIVKRTKRKRILNKKMVEESVVNDLKSMKFIVNGKEVSF